MTTALITGGAKGIGQAISQALVTQHDMNLILWGRNQSDLDRAAAELGRLAPQRHIHSCSVDMGDLASLEAGLTDVQQTGLTVDVLVNNAGILTDQPLMDLSDNDIMEHTMVNAIGPLRLIRALAPAMVEQGYGRIVNVSSCWGSFAEGLGPGAYGITKAFLNAITVKTASELPHHVKINAACPGWVRTRMGGAGATLSTEEGAATPVWLATLPIDGPTGGFFRGRQPISW